MKEEIKKTEISDPIFPKMEKLIKIFRRVFFSPRRRFFDRMKKERTSIFSMSKIIWDKPDKNYEKKVLSKKRD